MEGRSGSLRRGAPGRCALPRRDSELFLDQLVQGLAVVAQHLCRDLLVHGEIDFLVAIEIDGELVARGQRNLTEAGRDHTVIDHARRYEGGEAKIFKR